MEALVWECAGRLGIDPGGLTLRALLAMDEAQSRQRWDHTAFLAALVVNCLTTGRRFHPREFHPHYPPAEAERLSAPRSVDLLWKLFGSKR